MYRVINANSNEVLSLDEITKISEARSLASEIESHESQPEVTIQQLVDGEWVEAKNDAKKAGHAIIEISVDGVWAGSGKLRGDMDSGHQIVDCAAQLGADQDASESVYEAIEDAIDEGADEITVDGKRITWTITVPA